MNKIADRLFDATVRFEKMFWLPGICAEPTREFEEFCEEDADGLEDTLPELKKMLDGGWSYDELPGELIGRGRSGIIALAATPRPDKVYPDGSFSFTWGHYSIKWLYADTLEELAERAALWAEGIVSAAKAKAKEAVHEEG